MPYAPIGPSALTGYNKFTLLSTICSILQETPGQGWASQLSDDLLMTNLQSAYEEMNQVAAERYCVWLISYVNMTVIDDTTGEFDVAWNTTRGDIICFKQRRGSDDIIPGPNELPAVRRDALNNVINSAQGPAISQFNGRFYRASQGTQKYFRLWYMRKPRALHYGNPAGTTQTVNTLVFGETPTGGTIDSIYPGYYDKELVLVRFAETTGGEQPQCALTAVALIDNYLGIPPLATTGQGGLCQLLPINGATQYYGSGTAVGDALPRIPTSSDVYSLIPWFDVEYWRLLCYKAAVMFTKMPEAQAEAINRKIQVLEGAWLKYLSRDDERSVRSTVDNGNFSVGLAGGDAWGSTDTGEWG